MAEVDGQHKSHGMGLHEEQLTGRTQQIFFSPEESDNFLYPESFEVDLDNKAEFDAGDMEISAINLKIRALMQAGHGHIVVKNPLAKHSLGVGILNRLKLEFEGSLGYFGCGLIDGPNVTVHGRVGWSFAENMMAGVAVVEKNAGSTFGAAIRGGDLVCKGDVGSRTGIDQKGGTVIVGGRSGAFSGFMMQRGRMIILGDAGINLGDSMYDGTIYVGGKIESLGVDAVPGEISDLEADWIERKLSAHGLSAPNGVKSLQKIVAGKKLWNYDNLEPTEKKIVL
ncbi:MAG: GXGXG motif-containing protein [Rhodospirillaceae bacterium]|jgi:glutamate synthase domain-containing protein 3|nr:GXGXG motif-containing protein [Rhodospirillaceae bacterium]MBT3929006.1 GXGXG motif-containing protein [Rhodospirillaceae bacterium]MBT4425442.1 GXGXG motif-containing protein [Rhodospirillaceae bacterium]MBT5038208.1 GXGXG motif-containing protein [Rhodospirillaceae bacterium]MBT5676125.1 GXGXG motif-containing protein [Rhodospirillaceae bacterium]